MFFNELIAVIYLLRFANTIEESFNVIFLVQMLNYSITICLQGYQLIEVSVKADA